MRVAELIEGRRSIRKYAQKAVAPAVMQQLLHQAAVYCPHPERLVATRFVLAIEEVAREKLVGALVEAFAVSKLGKWLPKKLQETAHKRYMEIPGHLVVIASADSGIEQEAAIAEACYMMQTMQLLAWEQGIGMLWDSDEILYVPAFQNVLQLAPGERMLGVLHFGYIDKVPRARKRTDAAKRWRAYPHIQ